MNESNESKDSKVFFPKNPKNHILTHIKAYLYAPATNEDGRHHSHAAPHLPNVLPRTEQQVRCVSIGVDKHVSPYASLFAGLYPDGQDFMRVGRAWEIRIPIGPLALALCSAKDGRRWVAFGGFL
jgi:hypothetical protein